MLFRSYLHKKACEKWLPKEVVYRKKKGFANPVEDWFRDRMRPFVEECLLSRDSSMALYFDQINFNLNYAQPISNTKKTENDSGHRKFHDLATNKLQGTVSYFPAMNLPYVTRDNLELTFGLQVNTFGNNEDHHIRSAGVGPVFGLAVMPWQNVEVNVVKASFDNRSRYKVDSGIRYFFARTNSTLKELRRKYLETDPPVAGYTKAHSD